MVEDELIVRLEKATGADRRLDFDIWASVTKPTGFPELSEPEESRTRWFEGWKNDADSFPAYTASIDAALTLLPDFISYELTASAASTFSRARLWDWRRSPTMSDPGNEWKSEGKRPLAVNLCIAALKARSATTTPAHRESRATEATGIVP